MTKETKYTERQIHVALAVLPAVDKMWKKCCRDKERLRIPARKGIHKRYDPSLNCKTCRAQGICGIYHEYVPNPSLRKK